MEKSKRYIKVFFTDDEDKNIINLGGVTTDITTTTDELCEKIGADINTAIDEDCNTLRAGTYGFRIDYTLTPIRTDPFK